MNTDFLFSLEVLGCRIYQGVFKLMNYTVGYRMPEYIYGPGSILRLPELLREKGADDLLIVTDRTLMKLGLLDRMLQALDQAGIRYACFSEVGANPTIDEVEAGLRCYHENGCKAVLAFGGGSPMDCAKAICARIVHPNKTVVQMQGLLKVSKKIPTLFAVPTTSGTGSETTVISVITDPVTHHKASISDPCLTPRYAILDPELTVGLPPHVTATTGIDALSHAVEAYVNQTYNSSLEDDLARKAVKLVYDNILTVYENGSDLEARQNMQFAALFAGRAFTRGCVGYVHGIGHTLGGLYGVPHGYAMAILLPHVLREYGSAAHKRLAELADLCGMGGETDAQKGERFLAWIEQTNRKMGIPDSLDMIRDEDIDQMIAWARKESHPLFPVPVIWSKQDFRSFIEKVRTK